MEKKKVIFVVEDDPGFNVVLTSYLTSKNKWEVHSFQSGEESLEKLSLGPVIFLQDFDLPKMNGLEVMKAVKQIRPEVEFIFLSGQTNVKVAVEALHLGAFDYLVKDANAKENALNKIDQIIKLKKLEEQQQQDKKFKVVLICLLIVLLAAIGVLSFLGVIKY